MSTLVDSEFRKLVATLLWAEQYAVVRGFEVEPESPASARVMIRMDRSADSIGGVRDSIAIGVQDFGAVESHGVLIGGRDMSDALEGAGLLLLDFSALPPGDYVVEMRHNETPSTSENRAFWNEAADIEFVATVPTRTSPAWEVQIAPSVTGGGWIPLADVEWGGSTIPAASIDDRRFLMFEGPVGPDDAGPYSYASQTDLPIDFSRSRFRGLLANTTPSFAAAILALQRQIADIKGQSTIGEFNWWARPFAPDLAGIGGDPDIAGAWGKQSKTLRTVDTVSYTIGHAGDFGDFNGTSGLQDCLNWIMLYQNRLPRRIRILIKNRNPATVGSGYQLTSFAVNTLVLLANKDIEIEGGMGTGRNLRTTEPAHDVRGQALITSTPTGGLVFALTGRSSLKLKNITWVNNTADSSLLNVSGPVDFENVVLNYAAATVNYLTHYVLLCHSDQTWIRQSQIIGRVQLGGAEDLVHGFGGRIENTLFSRCSLRLNTSSASASAVTIFRSSAQRLTFDSCYFEGRVINTSNPANAFGMIDARGVSHLVMRNCVITHSANEDGVRLGNILSTDTFKANSANIDLGPNNEFALFADDNNHTVNAGVGGTDGTGHHIFCKQATLASTLEQTSSINIYNSLFFGGAGGTGGSVDAGAITMQSPRYLRTKDNRFTDWADNEDDTVFRLVQVTSQAQLTPFPPFDIHVDDNYFGDWASITQGLGCVTLSNVTQGSCKGNTFNRYPRVPVSGVLVTSALAIINANQLDVSSNIFIGWLNSFAPAAAPGNILLSGSIDYCNFNHNQFISYGGFGIYAMNDVSVYQSQFIANMFSPFLGSATNFTAAIDLSQAVSTEHIVFIGNKWTYEGGAGGSTNRRCVHLGDADNFTFVGNWFANGLLGHATLGAVIDIDDAEETFGFNGQLNYIGGVEP